MASDVDMTNESTVLFEDISPDKDKKILKTIVQQGEGEEHPFSGCKVFVHYTGRLEDGEKFDSSHDRGDVFSFSVGTNSVIKGWDIGILTMKRNEVAEFKIHPDYAYGPQGFPPKIPGNATLIFEVELLSWDDEDVTEDKGVRKQVIKEGDGMSKPKLDSKVKIHLRGTYKGVLFDERDAEFVIGEGYEIDIIDGVEKALCKMKRHERARIFVKAEYAYKDIGYEKYDIPPNADELEFDIVLHSFERPKEIYEMEYQEKVDRADLLKKKALKCINAKEYKKAIQFYDRILTFVKINKNDSDYQVGLPYKIAANANAALCFLKLTDYQNAKLRCEKVIKLDQNHVKGHFRLGEACLGLNDFGTAVTAYENVIALDPDNKVAKKQVQVARIKRKQQTDKEKKLYGAMLFR